MRVTVLGAGPAGLYLAILLRQAGPHEITVLERNAPDATFGWGVVFSEETLGALREADNASYTEITDTFAHWDAIDIDYLGDRLRCRGHAFSAIARKRLLALLRRRCTDLGVELRFHTEISDPGELAGDTDLIVAADGVNSTVRNTATEAFGTRVRQQGCKYIWYGTDLVFDAFQFIFARTEHGMFQVHGYPYDERGSTFIVETPEVTWHGAGLDEMNEVESITFCEKLFAAQLGGHRLHANRSGWLSFPDVRNRHWYRLEQDVPIVLLGDAAHTAHFTIGSGTKLAMEDAIALANALVRHGASRAAIPAALADYEAQRQAVVQRFQQAAADSADYFARVERHTHLPPRQFAMNLLTRSGRIGHANLTTRDPEFVRIADVEFASGGQAVLGPPPVLVALRLGDTTVPNRVVRTAATPADLARAAHSGAGLVLAGPAAVSEDGRSTPETPTMASDWAAAVAEVHRAGGRAGLRLAHAGRRAATRPARFGVDVPLAAGQAWQLLSASALPYGPLSQIPRALRPDDMDRVREAYVAATQAAERAGFDLLELDCAHGCLPASFLSPLSNVRTDSYGGSAVNRLRFPLELLTDVAAAWAGKPLAVRLSVTDWAPGGLPVDAGVEIARAMAAAGACLVHVEAGQTVAEARPVYRRGFLTAMSDRVRSEARVSTLAGGYLTTLDEINTAVGAGRADLCVLDLPPTEQEAA